MICEDYKNMMNRPETSTTYKRSKEIIKNITANKELYRVDATIDPFGTAFKETKVYTQNTALRPDHYNAGDTYEVFNVLEAWNLDKDFYLGNVIKYVARAGKKDKLKEIEDLEKAKVYLERRINELKKL